MIDRNSYGYMAGRVLAKGAILLIGIVIGKSFFKKPIDKGYPER